jgi:hypothetical protein
VWISEKSQFGPKMLPRHQNEKIGRFHIFLHPLLARNASYTLTSFPPYRFCGELIPILETLGTRKNQFPANDWSDNLARKKVSLSSQTRKKCSRNFKLNETRGAEFKCIYSIQENVRKERKEGRKKERESFFELVELDKGYKGVTVVKRTKQTHAKR